MRTHTFIGRRVRQNLPFVVGARFGDINFLALQFRARNFRANTTFLRTTFQTMLKTSSVPLDSAAHDIFQAPSAFRDIVKFFSSCNFFVPQMMKSCPSALWCRLYK